MTESSKYFNNGSEIQPEEPVVIEDNEDDCKIKFVFEDPIRSSNYPSAKRFKSDIGSDKKPRSLIKTSLEDRFRSYTLLGTEIHFPHRPYAVQIALMTRVIKALKSSEHALLESPTGTGKTLSLLCSTLAWQKEKIKEIEENFLKEANDKKKAEEASGKSNDPSVIPTEVSDGDDDFVQLPQHMIDIIQTHSLSNSLSIQDSYSEATTETQPQNPKATKNKKNYFKKPKIYYGTRTHKQIAQVVKELRENTPYLPEIAILGSREQYCIHPTASKDRNKNEKCQKLCTATRQSGTDKLWGQVKSLRQYLLEEGLDESDDNKGDNLASIFNNKPKKDSPKAPKINKKHCIYSIDNKFLARQMRDPTFVSNLRENNNVTSGIWDIEDIRLAGKKVVGCPFYAARILAESADIIFCPYNYILHPSIRKNMNVTLEGNIFIFDEAHNIEDIARESASLDISYSSLQSIVDEFNFFQGTDYEADIIKLLINVLIKFMDSDSGFIKNEFEMDKEQRIWHPDFFWKFLAEYQLGKEKLPQLIESLEILRRFKKTQEFRGGGGETQGSRFVISDIAEQAIDSIFEVLTGLVNHETAYKIATVKTLQNKKEWSVNLGFWCQDSGTVFSFIASKARTVILASGTLSPLNTFSSELNSKFNHVLEGSHVVGSDQLWAGILPSGPSGTQFLGTYQNTQSHSYQDDMGDSILKIVEKVPNGILCFFPSYASMNRLTSRWKSTNTWSKIEESKTILIEPSNNRAEFEEVLSSYRSLSKDQGAILLGVFRGKFSEGIDFRDNECRCVISIGIPFPFLKDLKVELKKSFNGRYAQSRGMLNGSDWYVIQGYRAINQALGRCIRHHADWGSIVLLESRFAQSSHSDFLSKWILKSMSLYSNFDDAISSLDQFMKYRLEIEKLPPVSNVSELSTVSNPSNLIELKSNVTILDKSPISRNCSEIKSELLNQTPETSEVGTLKLEFNHLTSPNITVSPIKPPLLGFPEVISTNSSLESSELSDLLSTNLMDPKSNNQDSFDSTSLKSPVTFHQSIKESSSISINHFSANVDNSLEYSNSISHNPVDDKQENDVSLSNLSESILNVSPWKRISCEDCQKFLFLASSEYVKNDVISQLKYPSNHFKSYIAVKLQSLPKHSLSHLDSSQITYLNSYTDVEDGISYGHLECKECKLVKNNSEPMIINILLQSEKIQENLCRWVWVHPSFLKQLGYEL